MNNVKPTVAARSRAYKSKSGIRANPDKVNWGELAKLAAEGARRVEEKYGRYVEPERIFVRARECA